MQGESLGEFSTSPQAKEVGNFTFKFKDLHHVFFTVSLALLNPRDSSAYNEYLNNGMKNWGLGADDISQCVKVLTSKSDDLSSVPGAHTVEGETWLPQAVLWFHVHTLTRVYTHKNK